MIVASYVDAKGFTRRYRVQFRYYAAGTTQCYIDMRLKSEEEWLPVCVGEALLHPLDRFEREVGRKVALTDALSGCDEFSLCAKDTLADDAAKKAKRRAVWNAYHGRSKRTASRMTPTVVGRAVS